MKIKHLIIVLAGMVFITPAQAENPNDWYISGAMGLTKTNDAGYDDEETGLTGDLEIDNGTNFAVAAGFQMTDHVRGEIELSRRKADGHSEH